MKKIKLMIIFLLLLSLGFSKTVEVPNIQVFENPKKEVTTVESKKQREQAKLNITVRKKNVKEIVGELGRDTIFFYFQEKDNITKDSKFFLEPNLKNISRKRRSLSREKRESILNKKEEILFTYEENLKNGSIEINPNRFKDGIVYFSRVENGKTVEKYKGYIPRFPRPASSNLRIQFTDLGAVELNNDDMFEQNLFDKNGGKSVNVYTQNKKSMSISYKFENGDTYNYIDGTNNGTQDIYTSNKYGTRGTMGRGTKSLEGIRAFRDRTDYKGSKYNDEDYKKPSGYELSNLKIPFDTVANILGDNSSQGYYRNITLEVGTYDMTGRYYPVPEFMTGHQRYIGSLRTELKDQIGKYRFIYTEKYCENNQCDEAKGTMNIYLKDRYQNPNNRQMTGSVVMGDIVTINPEIDPRYPSIKLALTKNDKTRDYTVSSFATDGSSGLFFYNPNTGKWDSKESQLHRTGDYNLEFTLKYYQKKGGKPELYVIIKNGDIFNQKTYDVNEQIECKADGKVLRRLKLTKVTLFSSNKDLGIVKYELDKRLKNSKNDQGVDNNWLSRSGMLKARLQETGKSYKKLIKIAADFNQLNSQLSKIKITDVNSVADQYRLLDLSYGNNHYKGFEGVPFGNITALYAAIPYNITLGEFVSSSNNNRQLVSIKNMTDSDTIYPFKVIGNDGNMYAGKINVKYIGDAAKTGKATLDMSDVPIGTKGLWKYETQEKLNTPISSVEFDRSINMIFTSGMLFDWQSQFNQKSNKGHIATRIDVKPKDGPVESTPPGSMGTDLIVSLKDGNKIGIKTTNNYTGLYIEKADKSPSTIPQEYTISAYNNDILLGSLTLTIIWSKEIDIGNITFEMSELKNFKNQWVFNTRVNNRTKTKSAVDLKDDSLKNAYTEPDRINIRYEFKNLPTEGKIDKDTPLEVDGNSALTVEGHYKKYKDSSNREVAIPLINKNINDFNNEFPKRFVISTKDNLKKGETETHAFRFFIHNKWYKGSITKFYKTATTTEYMAGKIDISDYPIDVPVKFLRKKKFGRQGLESETVNNKNYYILGNLGDHLPFWESNASGPLPSSSVDVKAILVNGKKMNNREYIDNIKGIKIELDDDANLIITKLKNVKNFQYPIWSDPPTYRVQYLQTNDLLFFGKFLELNFMNKISQHNELGKFTVTLDGRLKEGIPGRDWIYADGKINSSVAYPDNQDNHKYTNLIKVTPPTNWDTTANWHQNPKVHRVVKLDKNGHGPYPTSTGNEKYQFSGSPERAMPINILLKDLQHKLVISKKNLKDKNTDIYDFTLLGEYGYYYTGQLETKYNSNSYNIGKATVDMSKITIIGNATDWTRWDNPYDLTKNRSGDISIQMKIDSGKIFDWREISSENSHIVTKLVVTNVDNPNENETVENTNENEKIQTNNIFKDNQIGFEKNGGFFIVKLTDTPKASQTRYKIEIYNYNVKLGELELTIINEHNIGKINFEVDTRMAHVANTKWLFNDVEGHFTKGIDQTPEIGKYKDNLFKVTGNFNQAPKSTKITNVEYIAGAVPTIDKTGKKNQVLYKVLSNFGNGYEAAMPKDISFIELEKNLVISLKKLNNKNEKYDYNFKLKGDDSKAYNGYVKVKLSGDKAESGIATVDLSSVRKQEKWIGWDSTKIATNGTVLSTHGITDIEMKFSSGHLFNWKSGFIKVPTGWSEQGHVVTKIEVKENGKKCEIKTVIANKKWECQGKDNKIGIDDWNFYITKENDSTIENTYNIKLYHDVIVLGELTLKIKNQKEESIGSMLFTIDTRLKELNNWLFSDFKLSDSRFYKSPDNYSKLMKIKDEFINNIMPEDKYIKEVKEINGFTYNVNYTRNNIKYHVYTKNTDKAVMPTGIAPNYTGMSVRKLKQNLAIYLKNTNSNSLNFKVRGTNGYNYNGTINIKAIGEQAETKTEGTVDLSTLQISENNKLYKVSWDGKIREPGKIFGNIKSIFLDIKKGKLFNWKSSIDTSQEHIVTKIEVTKGKETKSGITTGNNQEAKVEFSDNTIGIDKNGFFITKKNDNIKPIIYDIKLYHHIVLLGKLKLTVSNQIETDIGKAEFQVDTRLLAKKEKWLFKDGILTNGITEIPLADKYNKLLLTNLELNAPIDVKINAVEFIANKVPNLEQKKNGSDIIYKVLQSFNNKNNEAAMPKGINFSNLTNNLVISLKNLIDKDYNYIFKLKGDNNKIYTGEIIVVAKGDKAEKGIATVDLSRQLLEKPVSGWVGWKSDMIGKAKEVISNDGTTGIEMKFSSGKLFNWQTGTKSITDSGHIVTKLEVNGQKGEEIISGVKFQVDLEDNAIGIDNNNFYITKKSNSIEPKKYSIKLYHHTVLLGILELTVTNNSDSIEIVGDKIINFGAIPSGKVAKASGKLEIKLSGNVNNKKIVTVKLDDKKSKELIHTANKNNKLPYKATISSSNSNSQTYVYYNIEVDPKKDQIPGDYKGALNMVVTIDIK